MRTKPHPRRALINMGIIIIFLRITSMRILIALISTILRPMRAMHGRQIMEIVQSRCRLGAIIHFDIESARVIQTRLGAHDTVVAEAGLATVNDHVEPDGCDVRDQSCDGECEEGFVGSADGYAG
jgi:hypothetical protein